MNLNDIINQLETITEDIRKFRGGDTTSAPEPKVAHTPSQPESVKVGAAAEKAPYRINLRTNEGRLHFQVKPSKGSAPYDKFLIPVNDDAFSEVAHSEQETRDSFANSSTQYLKVEQFAGQEALGELVDALRLNDSYRVADWIGEYVY